MPQDYTIPKPEITFLKSWFLAIRPKTLTASISPVVFIYGYLKYSGQQNLSTSVFLTTLFCALFMQIGTNLVNDYFDGVQGIDNHQRLGPTRVVAAGIIPARRVQFGYQICFLIAFLLGFYLMVVGGLPIIVIGISSLIAAYCYTGGPVPLSRLGLGEFLAFFYFGPIACLGTAILLKASNLQNIFILSLPMGMWSAALMSVNNLRDIESDKKTKKTTIATMLGNPAARYFTLTLLIAPFIFHLYTIFYLKQTLLFLIPLLSILPLVKEFKRVTTAPLSHEFNITLGQTGKSLSIYTLSHLVLFLIL